MSYAVPTVTLADGREMPMLAWGNADVPNKGKAVTAIDVATRVFSSGFSHLDTAEGYDCTLETARFLREFDPAGGRVFFTSKVAAHDGSPDAPPISPAQVREKVLRLIEAYGRQPDVLLMHNPFVTESVADLWAVLDEMKDSGELTASLGISNYHPRHLKEVLRVAKHKPVVHQLEVHPYVLSHIDAVLELCREQGIAVSAFAPLAPLSHHPSGGPAKPVLERIGATIAEETGKDVDGSSALLLWLRTRGITPILGSHNPERLARYAATQALRDLTPEVDAAGRRVYFRKWDEHFTAASDPAFAPPELPQDA